jgi:hypothetical protein
MCNKLPVPKVNKIDKPKKLAFGLLFLSLSCALVAATCPPAPGHISLNQSPQAAGPMLTWVNASLPQTAYWADTCYGNGVYVAIAYNSSVCAMSSNGLNWTAESMPLIPSTQPDLPPNAWESLAFGNGVFVALPACSGKGAISSNGVAWTLVQLPVDERWYAIRYGNNHFVGIALDGSSAWSTNGLNWVSSATPLPRESNATDAQNPANWQGLGYGNGVFVATSEFNNLCATSPDGANWAVFTLPESLKWESVAYGNGAFVAIAEDTTILATSPNGYNWVERNFFEPDCWQSVTFGGDIFVAVAYNYCHNINSNVSAWSRDGITWVESRLPQNACWTSVCYENGLFIAVAAYTASCAVAKWEVA